MLSIERVGRSMPAPLAANNRPPAHAAPEVPMSRLAARLTHRGAVLAVLLLAAPLLSGCDTSESKFAPSCPRLALLAEGADLTRFAGGGGGTGRDVTDRVLEARIAGVEASCRSGRNGDVVAKLKVQADVARGPAARGRSAQVPYFVAVMDGDAVLDRREFVMEANFGPNVDSVRVSASELELRFPQAGDRGASQYRIIVSLQLTEEELAYNRRAATR